MTSGETQIGMGGDFVRVDELDADDFTRYGGCDLPGAFEAIVSALIALNPTREHLSSCVAFPREEGEDTMGIFL